MTYDPTDLLELLDADSCMRVEGVKVLDDCVDGWVFATGESVVFVSDLTLSTIPLEYIADDLYETLHAEVSWKDAYPKRVA
jgi:hypothetical protein